MESVDWNVNCYGENLDSPSSLLSYITEEVIQDTKNTAISPGTDGESSNLSGNKMRHNTYKVRLVISDVPPTLYDDKGWREGFEIVVFALDEVRAKQIGVDLFVAMYNANPVKVEVEKLNHEPAD